MKSHVLLPRLLSVTSFFSFEATTFSSYKLFLAFNFVLLNTRAYCAIFFSFYVSMLSVGPYLFISVVHLYYLAHAYFFPSSRPFSGLYFGIFFLQFSDPHIYFSFTQRFLLFFAVYCLSSYI